MATANGSTEPANETTPVTFRYPSESVQESVMLVGEFNHWDPLATAMERDGDHYVRTIELETGRGHRYKFFIDGERWENDATAGSYVQNEFGGHDSVCDVDGDGAQDETR